MMTKIVNRSRRTPSILLVSDIAIASMKVDMLSETPDAPPMCVRHQDPLMQLHVIETTTALGQQHQISPSRLKHLPVRMAIGSLPQMSSTIPGLRTATQTYTVLPLSSAILQPRFYPRRLHHPQLP